ncbi:MAG: flagellar basal body P-ring formation chaperone FlgA [Gammaproteobacteria bacterium]|nr:flagellar basal body P-ring formation chaperone FlgA [Gammaproteobacteria bacterium]
MHESRANHWLLIGVLLWAGVLHPGTARSAVEWQSHDAIRAAAEAAASQAITGSAEVTADRPDPRLQLIRCDRPLAATVPSSGVRSSRLTAEVRCDGAQPWRLYLPVRVASTRLVVVATRALARDTVLAPGDVRLAKLPSGTGQVGTLHDPAQAVGRRLRHSMDEGQALTAGVVVAPTLVRRGQQVSVEATGGGLQVRMAGVAQGDGALGDIIDVESGTSGRVIQAVVRSAQSVEVLLR